MCQNRCFNEFKLLDIENRFEKFVYMVENTEERKNRLNFESQNRINNSSIVNINKINNCGSLYIKDFKIRYLRKEDINKPQICNFNPLQENKNPFLSLKFDFEQKRFIDLKNIQDTEENIKNIFSLDSD